MPGNGVAESLADGRIHLIRSVHPGNAFAASGIRGFHNDRIGPGRRVFQRFLHGRVSLGLRYVEAVLFQESPEAVLVLEDFHAFQGAEGRKTHPGLDIGGGNHAGIHAEGHDAVDLLVDGRPEDGFPVDDVHIHILVREPVGDVVGKIVHRENVIPLLVRGLDDRQQVSDSSEEHQPFLLHGFIGRRFG